MSEEVLEEARGLDTQLDARLMQDALALIEPAQRILLIAHEHPDGDCIGSALGLARILSLTGKRCVAACADAAPGNLVAPDFRGLAAQRSEIEAFGVREGFAVRSWHQDVQTGAGADALLLRPGLSSALKEAKSARCPLIVSRLDRLWLSHRSVLRVLQRVLDGQHSKTSRASRAGCGGLRRCVARPNRRSQTRSLIEAPPTGAQVHSAAERDGQ
jgi:hypothetical protein